MHFARLAALWTAVVAGSCGDSTSPGGGTPGEVSVKNNFFDPVQVNPNANEIVTWTWNSGGLVHTVTFEDGASDSGSRTSGTFTRNFTGATPGTYKYRCLTPGHSTNFDNGMVGRIVVQ